MRLLKLWVMGACAGVTLNPIRSSAQIPVEGQS